MKSAIISLTENGRELSSKIVLNSPFLSSVRFCFYTHSDKDSSSFENIGDLVSEIFNGYDALIFVCACGIAVRAVAPHLKSKSTDPAVVVIDDCGKFVIPVLSGHIGGANELAKKLAELLGAQAVITTATDIGGHFSPDSFAVANGLIVTDLGAAKAIAAAVLNGEKTGFVSDYKYMNLPSDVCTDTECHTGLYVGSADITPFPVTLKLLPRNIIIGIGCKHDTDCATIERVAMTALKTADIAIERVCSVATIDLKANERGLLAFCEKHSCELRTYTADELMKVDGDFTPSDFVKNVTGADNVCERSAVKCSGGKLILRKSAADGVTVAAAEKPMILDFERRLL